LGAVAAVLAMAGAALGQAPRPVEPWSLRGVMLHERSCAIARGDLAAAATIHATLGREAVLRAIGTHDAWMRLRNTRTGLFPVAQRVNEWNYSNVAADLFCFLWLASARTGAGSLPLLEATLEAEAALQGPGKLCAPARWDDGAELPRDMPALIFGTSEYAKDGLLSVVECLRDPRALARLDELARVIMAHAEHMSPAMPLPSGESEVNGNVLQVLCRLGSAREGDRFAQGAARIADAATGVMLPANHGLPALLFDYERGETLISRTMLRDHGNEIICGLAEALALAHERREDPVWRERGERWREPVLAMFERILSSAVDRNGLLVGAIDPRTGAMLDAAPNDNWGYVLCGALLTAQTLRREGAEAARVTALLERISAIAQAVARTDGLDWEPGTHDGYADAIESALYIAAHHPDTAGVLESWAHAQIGIMFAMQKADGFVGGTYLDGNFIRTALLYADLCTGGWSVSPPRRGVDIGFARDEAGRAALVVRAAVAYEGKLICPAPWSAHVLKMSWDWPRLNSWPRWSPPEHLASITEVTGLQVAPSVEALRAGLDLHLSAGDRVVISLQFTTPEQSPAAMDTRRETPSHSGE
jgi:hypothetical protein